MVLKIILKISSKLSVQFEDDIFKMSNVSPTKKFQASKCGTSLKSVSIHTQTHTV